MSSGLVWNGECPDSKKQPSIFKQNIRNDIN
jgi:hypothetical protein